MIEPKKRYVLDTNLIVSGTLNENSTSGEAFAKARSGGIILQSSATLAELEEVLSRKKFEKYLSIEKRIEFLEIFRNHVLMIEPKAQITACRDVKDNKFLELAMDGGAHLIISGDNDLLTLHPFQSIPILNPRAFLDQKDEA